MKRSTWRYFQRENELLLMWKSTRRAAMSAGRRGGEAIRGGGRDGDTVRIVRVDDVGLQVPDDARQPPGRWQIHLAARGDRHHLDVGGQALAQFAVRVGDDHHAVSAGAEAPAVSSTWFWPPRHVRAVSIWSENISVIRCQLPAAS